jgi:hypothetical protein
MVKKAHELLGGERRHLPPTRARREHENGRIPNDQAPLQGVPQGTVEQAVYLVQAVRGQAALAHPPVSGLDVGSDLLNERQVAEPFRNPPHVEVVALIGAGPNPLSRQLQPARQE